MTSTSLVFQEITDSAVEALVPFIAKAREASVVSEADAPFYLKEMVSGIVTASQLLASASLQYNNVRNQRKRKEAVAQLEKYPAYMAANGITKKGTVAEIEAFVSLDEDVIAMQDKEAFFDAMVTYVSSVRQSLILSHDDIKKTVYSRSLDNLNKTPMLG
jgi:hypothetical protein